VILFFMLVRWSWPRFRFDQLMSLAWKVMLPMGIANLLAVAIAYEATRGTFGKAVQSVPGVWLSAGAAWAVFVLAWLVFAWAGPLATDNRPRRDLTDYGIDPQV
jgi:NADH-quinone oxidoreductase subunit H